MPRLSEEEKKSLRDWMNSEEGRQALKDAMAKADEAIEQLKKARLIPLHELYLPMTI